MKADRLISRVGNDELCANRAVTGVLLIGAERSWSQLLDQETRRFLGLSYLSTLGR
jgi:hypothetical protein